MFSKVGAKSATMPCRSPRVKCLVASAHNLEVLLRHRPRSISRTASRGYVAAYRQTGLLPQPVGFEVSGALKKHRGLVEFLADRQYVPPIWVDLVQVTGQGGQRGGPSLEGLVRGSP